MAIVISMVSMVIKNLIATKKKKNKMANDMKNQTALMGRRRTRILLMFVLFTPSLTPSRMIGLLTLGVLISCVLKRINLKIFISIKKMQL